jgi:hypothetical protein
MTATWILEQRARDAISWAMDILEDTHPAPDASEHLAHLRTMNREVGFEHGQEAGLGAALAVAALCDVVEALTLRVEELEKASQADVAKPASLRR